MEREGGTIAKGRGFSFRWWICSWIVDVPKSTELYTFNGYIVNVNYLSIKLLVTTTTTTRALELRLLPLITFYLKILSPWCSLHISPPGEDRTSGSGLTWGGLARPGLPRTVPVLSLQELCPWKSLLLKLRWLVMLLATLSHSTGMLCPFGAQMESPNK